MGYLGLNLRRLNSFYATFGISFVQEREIIKMYRINERIFQEQPELKNDIRSRVEIIWNSDGRYWFLDSRGINKLRKNELKFSSDKNRDELKKKLFVFLEQIKEDALKSSIKEYLESKDIFFSMPAAIYYHHTYENGLLEHTVQTCELCISMLQYLEGITPIDNDVLIAGAILHDIGKINCYSCVNGITTVTDLMNEQDHIINGVKIIIANIKSKKIDKIIHVIASHHQTKEMGSPVEPVNNEAWIVSTADNLSAKILGG